MRQKIKIPLNNVIFKKENLKGIARCISKQENIQKTSFHITFMNELEIESNDINIFDDEKINEYEIKRIRMLYCDKDYKKNIDVWIDNYEIHKGSSYIEVSYESKENLDWLAVVEKDINDQLSYCDKRNKFISVIQNDNILFFTIAALNLLMSVFLGRIISRFANFEVKTMYSLISFIFVVLLFFSINLRDLFYKSFPRVEIDIQEKSNSSKKSRKKLEFVLITFVIPIIIDVFCNIIEKYL